MSYDYDPMVALAIRMIDRFGRDATLNQMTNTGTDWAPTRTKTTQQVRAVDVEHHVRDQSGTNVGIVARKLYIAPATGLKPAKGDTITIGSDTHEIEDVMELAPGGVTVLWELDLKR